MRLFNRRKEMEFDDPRLVGMSPLKATEENFGQQNQNLPTLNEERGGEGLAVVVTEKKSSNDRQPDKYRIPNGKSFFKYFVIVHTIEHRVIIEIATGHCYLIYLPS